ncbi:MAG: 30S ribosomal protein S20 [Candidatus Saccharibacteria bacterium]|nr:30S ribosomal protein S20 [Candidatus Saccharibacteria bacterium]
MPIIKSAKKAARQATKRTAHNVEIKKSIKAALKAFKANPTMETLAKAQSEYDKAAKKDLLKKNTASRRKAALARFAKKAGMKIATVEKKAVKEVAEKVEKKPAAKKATTKTTAAKKTQSKAKAESK